MFNLNISVKTLIIPLIGLVYFVFQVYKHWKELCFKGRRLWLAARILLIISLIVVLSGQTLELASKDTSTIFLIDSSLSMKSLSNEIEKYLNEQLMNKKSRDKIAVIGFGRDYMIEIPLQNNINNVNLSSEPNPNFTNIEGAVDFAINYFPEETNRRLVIISDCKENLGNVSSLHNKLRGKGINLEIYPMSNDIRQDVQLTSLEIPKNFYDNGDIQIDLRLDSNITSVGTFFLYCENEQILADRLEVTTGENIFKFNIPLKERESIEFKGEISFEGDKNLRNNKLSKTIEFNDSPRVLILGEGEDTEVIKSLTESIGLKVMTYSPEEVPHDINFISKFQGIFLVNVPHDKLDPDFELNLSKAVKELGTGLMVIGGEESFAMGEYKDTLLEEMLPVSCHMKGKKKKSNVGLILAIDCSGSMDEESNGIKKIDMAKEAAIRSLEILEDEDYLGVLGFSDTLEWIVPFERVIDKDSIKHKIGRLSSKGGTLILPSVAKSVEKLEGAPVKIKHIILLSDGQGEKSGYDEQIKKMEDNKITLSSVAMGSDADVDMLKELSDNTNGRSYMVKGFENIPKIFVKETYLATKKYINNEEFDPLQVDAFDYFPSTYLPPLKGYMGTGIKENASLILKTHLDDPLLATWRYGLGKVLVWTSDLNGRWSTHWIKWDGFYSQWSGLINWYISNEFEGRMKVELMKDGGEVKVLGAVKSQKKKEEMEIVFESPEGLKKYISMEQISPGKYSGKFYLNKAGNYLVNIRLKNRDEIIESVSRRIHMDYSPEYLLDNGDGVDNLRTLANRTQGRIIDEKVNIFEQPLIKSRSEFDIGFILLPFALLLFIFDIAVRKI
ncbi:VWA domain-containing protein [Wukongibacter sp. M2B1]|uniref:VWA domain-containing protein n=1 Tax=Wukongibacter sp. M2B1 TaxID=3088895 RepID=UPI003D7ADB5C